VRRRLGRKTPAFRHPAVGAGPMSSASGFQRAERSRSRRRHPCSTINHGAEFNARPAAWSVTPTLFARGSYRPGGKARRRVLPLERLARGPARCGHLLDGAALSSANHPYGRIERRNSVSRAAQGHRARPGGRSWQRRFSPAMRQPGASPQFAAIQPWPLPLGV